MNERRFEKPTQDAAAMETDYHSLSSRNILSSSKMQQRVRDADELIHSYATAHYLSLVVG